jgi:hypothetical protein
MPCNVKGPKWGKGKFCDIGLKCKVFDVPFFGIPGTLPPGLFPAPKIQKCAIDVENSALPLISLTAASIATLASLAILATWALYPFVRAWPAGLFYWRALSDVLFAGQLVVLQITLMRNGDAFLPPDHCQKFAACLAFGAAGSLGWFLA